MPDEPLPQLPHTNPHYVPGGLGEAESPVGSRFGYWTEAVSHQGHRLGYFIWREVEKQHTLRDPLIVTTQGVRLVNPA